MIVKTFMWKNVIFVNFGVSTMMKMPQNDDLNLENGSKMGQKWPKFSFFSAEMTGTQVKSVKIDESQWDTTISYKKKRNSRAKNPFQGSFWPKMGKIEKK